MQKPNGIKIAPRLKGRLAFAAIALCFVGFGIAGAMVADRLMEESARTDAGPQVEEQAFIVPDTGITRAIEPERSRPEWLENAVRYAGPPDQARLAIVLVDDGRDAGSTLNALRLKDPVTLAVSPTVDGARARAAAARRLDREVLLLLPMESGASFDTTPNPIASHVGRDELLRRLSWNLAQLDGYVGVTNQFGEATTRDAKTMRTVMEALSDRGLLFVDARAHSESVAGAVARRLGVAVGDNAVSVDAAASADTVRERLEEAAVHAQEWGEAIILIPAQREAVRGLKAWLKTRRSAVAITPVTSVIRRLRSGAS